MRTNLSQLLLEHPITLSFINTVTAVFEDNEFVGEAYEEATHFICH